ncbi:type ISP restriction/modification enzyme [Aeromicrobium sp.]|uniref:type ISP restriction/modification enzyme n=1 Tax=Aeromicrobium sp. TaxID=1871063 RepID=UPI0030BE15B3
MNNSHKIWTEIRGAAQAEGEGGWVESGDSAYGDRSRPILDDFKADGNGRFEYVLKNLYVYFWRWATWKVFDAAPEDGEGVVCFISTNGYQRGPGFRGMREYLRRTCTAGWIIDVSPEGHQPDVPTRVFPGVQQTLSIGIFVRGVDVSEDTPADISYVALSGRREDKYRALEALTLDSPSWRKARTGWQAPFTPAADSSWDDYPALNDLMPWTAPGVKANRTWVYAPLAETLVERWRLLTSEDDRSEQVRLFKASRDSAPDRGKQPLPGHGDRPSDSIATDPGPVPLPVRVGYRSFDRQWLIPDIRAIDHPRPPLWAAIHAGQVYVVEQHSKIVTSGPGIVLSGLIPDMDHFKGSEGGRTLPFLHPNGAPNIAPGLTEALASILDIPVTAEDVLAYMTAIVSSPAFTATFADELTTPGIRVPITADADTWVTAVAVGKQIVWAQTYGTACAAPSDGRPKDNVRIQSGSELQQPLCTVGVTQMPTTMSYDEEGRTLHIGDGVWSPVDPRVVEYAVGGKNVLKSWFGYRKKEPGGRKSSPLDYIHPQSWPSEWTTDLTDLLAVLTRLVSTEAEQEDLLTRVVTGRVLERPELEANGVRWPRTAADRNPRYSNDESSVVGEQLSF